MKAIVIDKNYGSVTADEIKAVEKAFAKAGITLEAFHFETEDEIIEGCRDADAILCTGNPPVTRRVMEALPRLVFIQRFGVGVNSIDLKAAEELGKIVLNIPGFCARELADLAAAMIMGLVRNTAYYDRQIRGGAWPKCTYLLPPDIRTYTLGLYGFGAAGQNLYRIMHGGFGMKVIACDPFLPKEVKAKFPEVTFTSFENLVRESDIVSIHVGLTPDTYHIFNRETFRQMKDTAMIINTARGPIIDQEALAWALETGEIRYAGLDTVEKEPIAPDDPLLSMDNVILSAHCGSYGAGAKKTQLETVCRLIPDAILSRILPARNVANKGVMDRTPAYSFC